MDDLGSDLRDRIFIARIRRQIGHSRVVREHDVTLRLHAEFHEVAAESRRLRRRARWLLQTGRPLPKAVKP